MNEGRRSFLKSVGAVALIPVLPKAQEQRRLTVEVLINGTWVNVPRGLLYVAHKQRFRMINPDTGEQQLDATADSNGFMTENESGTCGGIYYLEDTAVLA